MITDVTRFRCGLLPHKPDPRHFSAASLLAAAPEPLTIAPTALDWYAAGTPTGVMVNDELGCCVVSEYGHHIQLWTANCGGSMVTVPDATIRSTYLYLTGGKDTGLVMADTMKYWRATGLAGHKILGYAIANSQDLVELKQCGLLFGGLALGLRMPRAWQWMDVWDAVDGPDGEPDTWGGHALQQGRFTEDGVDVTTWGYIQPVTWRGIAKYGNPAVGGEVWTMLSPEFLKSGVAPNQFLQAELEARQAAL